MQYQGRSKELPKFKSYEKKRSHKRLLGRRSVMNHFLSKFSLVIASIFVTTGGWAQTPIVKAVIPFSFSVNDVTVPAGTYTVTSVTTNSDILQFSDWKQKAHVLSMVQPNGNNNPKGADNVLVFHRVGGRYFLSEIRCRSCGIDSYLPVSKAEKLAKTRTLEAALPTGTNIGMGNDILVPFKIATP
jgi:hypothetical protein